MREKITYHVVINWKGELRTFYTTTTSETKAIVNACHKLGKETNFSGNKILLDILNSNKVQVSRA